MAAILAAGMLSLRIGIAASRGAARGRNLAAAAGAVLAVGGGAAHYPPLREVAGPWLRLPGGEAAMACLGASVLLGLLWADRRRSLSRPLLAAVTALVFLILIGLVSGSLGWRYFGQRLRANYPDASGSLRQTSGITCGPAAAAMLLHRRGIRISEGELAQLANTTPLQGTTPYALARAVDRVARRHGGRARIRRVDYGGAARLGKPFVAFVHRQGVGGHAVCVLTVEPTRARTIDPLSGTEEAFAREVFAAEWDPTIIWVEMQGE